MKHLRFFETAADKASAIAEGLALPNVNFCKEDGSVGYLKGENTPPNQ